MRAVMAKALLFAAKSSAFSVQNLLFYGLKPMLLHCNLP